MVTTNLDGLVWGIADDSADLPNISTFGVK